MSETQDSIFKLAHDHPLVVDQILGLVLSKYDQADLKNLLATCTCDHETQDCNCEPELG
jgi:hypothetical protein